MASKWVEIRDAALEALKQGAVEVGEETKQKFFTNFIESGVPVSKLTRNSSRRPSLHRRQRKAAGARFAMRS